MKSTKNENNIVLESLIFPTKHLPKCFTNYNVYNELDEIYKVYGNDVNNILSDNFELRDGKIGEFKGYIDNIYGLKKGTEPISLYISKPNGANRVLSIVNPLVLLPLHFYINYYHDEILSEQMEESDNYSSSSKFSFEEGEFVRAFSYDGDVILGDYANVVQKNYQYNLLNRQKICDGKYYHFGVDITNFFHSIYTHTISWNLVNPENKIVFDNFDVLTRALNGNETKGIVIGPYTSSLFSEIILSKVDRVSVPKCKMDDISYVRYCDDFDFYSDSKEKLENNTRLLVSEELSKYKLDLNMSKMKLDEFPFISLNTIQNKSIFLLLKRIEENDYKDSLEFIEDIMNEINSSIRIKYSNCNYLLKILSSRIKQKIITAEYFDEDTAEILLDFLINMSFKQNMISTEAFYLIIKIFNLLDLDKERIVTKWIKKRNNRISHIKEITDVWIMYLILTLKVCNDVCTSYMLDVMKNSDLCAILAFEYLDSNNLIESHKVEIKQYLDNINSELLNRFNSSWKKAGYYTKYWLLFYTNSKRWKIHEKKGFKDSILFHMNLNELLKDENLSKNLKLFKIFMELDIDFFIFY